MSTEIVAARDLNCLADDNRQTRKRALTKLAALPGAGHAPETLVPVWVEQLRAPVLRLFADPVEKNRELALSLASMLLASTPPALHSTHFLQAASRASLLLRCMRIATLPARSSLRHTTAARACVREPCS